MKRSSPPSSAAFFGLGMSLISARLMVMTPLVLAHSRNETMCFGGRFLEPKEDSGSCLMVGVSNFLREQSFQFK